MKHKTAIRMLAFALILALLGGSLPVGWAASNTADLRFEQSAADEESGARLDEALADDITEDPQYSDTDIVRVSIVLDGQSTLEAGYSAQNIAENAAAMSFRDGLRAGQDAAAAAISREALDGAALDVVWNMTLAANIISANVPYGAIGRIAQVDGVRSVVLERRYEPCVVDETETADPNMSTSSEMTGAAAAWAAGYTGAGSRIAVIDTGIDTDHQSFSSDGLDYALARKAEAAGVSLDEYLEGLDLLDRAEILEKLGKLNIASVVSDRNYDPNSLYLSTKLPFAFNYIDKSLDVTHDNDSEGEHGSHVAGIAAANRFIPNGKGGYTNALESVKTQGVAPDAQIIVLKVFGRLGGAYESDYMAAIEDAIILGCDAVNLSLGTGAPGWNRDSNEVYQTILDQLTESGIVATMSAGNSGNWVENSGSPSGRLYSGDVSMTTTGAPSTSANALAVASVDNAGYTGMYIKAGDTLIFYNEPAYENQPIVTLAGEQPYILIDGFGAEEDFADLGDVVQGKIVVCSRGGGVSFYVKGNNAVAAGAAGTIVYNNEAGSINMDLTDYTGGAPFVSVSQADGQVLRQNAVPVTDESGKVLYYTGTLTVGTQVGTSRGDTEFYTMSSFSSWGVPGSLTIKPEIAAPGGNIYSVNGAVPGGQAYENMSGTSMAAPQVAGMVAVAAEYFRESGLTERTGLTGRQLAQSMLMSTAVPLKEETSGSYWSMLQQGSGLANIGAVLASDTYLMMGGGATVSSGDGKIKAELGDDRLRTGSYDFSFTLGNLSDHDQRYTLSADLFTQGLFSYEGDTYLDTLTTALGADVVYTVDGVTYTPSVNAFVCDLDLDGDTDASDAQIILNYAAGLLDEIAPAADVDGDGAVTTYDAHLLLNQLETGTFLVKAGETAGITVQITLPENAKQTLDANYPNGTYVEGYVFAKPVSTDEGLAAPIHSIPVLAFYGNWTDASMYDRVVYTDYLYGDDSVPYLGYYSTNNLVIRHRRDNTSYFQIINPYLIEETYPEGRAAIRSTDTLYQYRLSLIRNAAAITTIITDQDGRELYTGTIFNQAGSAYYSTQGSWQDTVATYTMNRRVSSLDVKEGDMLHISVVAIPEYYEDGGDLTEEDVKRLISSGMLGEGAYLTTTLKVDDTAPEMLRVSKDLATGNLIVTARDNNYIAAVQVLNASGGEVLATAAARQDSAGGTAEAEVDLTGIVIGPTCKVLVADYAGNESVYTVNYGGEPEDYTGKMYGFTSAANRRGGSGERWLEITPDRLCYSSETAYDGTVNLDAMDITVTAAEYVKGYVYMAADDGKLYAAPQGEWDQYLAVGSLGGVVIKDMAYDYQNGLLYALDDANTIYTVDLLTGALTKAFSVTVTNPKVVSSSATFDKYKVLANLAIDDEGNFYAVTFGNSTYKSYLYKWSMADVEDGAAALMPVAGNDKNGHSDFYTTFGALAWDHDSDILYWATSTNATNPFATSQSNRLLSFNLETGKAAWVNPDYCLGKYPNIEPSQFYVGMTGLYIVPADGGTMEPAEEATGITVSPVELNLITGAEYTLIADVAPWTLADVSVNWSTSNPDVVSVDSEGNLLAVGPGSATVTATTNASPNLTASCDVTVEDLRSIGLSGLLYDRDGNTSWVEFQTADPESFTAFASGEGSYYGGAMLDGYVYVHDGERIYRFDPDTFALTGLGEISSDWIWSDAAPAPAQEDGTFGRLVAPCYGGKYLEVLNPEAGTLSYFNLSTDYSADPMAAIAYLRSGTYEDTYPAAYYYVLTESGSLWEFTLYTTDSGRTYSLVRTQLGSFDLDLGDVSDVTGGAYASMLYDQVSGTLLLSSYNGENVAWLYALKPEQFSYASLGNFGQNNWPVVSLYQYTRVTELTVRINPAHASLYERDTLALHGRVLPATYSQELEWSSSDESVATVDSNGVVTGHKTGTAVITATSVAVNESGEHASASSTVTVQPLMEVAATLKAQITDAEGSHWVSINTSDTENPTILADSTVQLTAGGWHDGKLYGIDGDYQSACNIWMVDPDNGFQPTQGAGCSVSYSFLDLAAAPVRDLDATNADKEPIVVEAFGGPLFLSNARTLVYLQSYETGTVTVPAWDIARKYPDIAALAFLGESEYRYNTVVRPAEDYIALCADGTLVMLQIYPSYVASEDRISYTLRQKELGNVGMRFANETALSMTYVHDDVNNGLIVAYSDGLAELYYIDLNAEALSIGKLGNVGSATAIAVPYVDTNPQQNPYPYTSIFQPATESTASSPISCSDNFTEERMEETEQSGDGAWLDSTEAGSSELPSGSLNAIVVDDTSTPEVEKDGFRIDTESNTVTLILAAQDTSNGLVTVTYDPSLLTLTNTSACIPYCAVNDSEAGSVVFAFAADSKLNTQIATVVFTYREEVELGLDTDITVTTSQDGSDLTSVDAEIVEVVIPGEVWPFPTPTPTPTPTPAEPSDSLAGFTDLTDEWYMDAVRYMVEHGLMNGVGDGKFAPNDDTTRGQIVTMLYRLEKEPAVKKSAGFADVADGQYYADAVAWAAANGIVNGMGDGKFAPNQAVTREQLAAILYRYAEYKGYDITARASLTGFSDADSVSSYAVAPLAWSVGSGIIEGSDGRLNPRSSTRRVEAAAMLMRFMENIKA